MLLVAAIAAYGTAQPVGDIDIYWHLLVGRAVWAEHTVQGIGNGWVAFGNDDWVTSQWLGEVIFFLIHQLAGWSGIVWLRALLVALALGSALFVIGRRRPVWATFIATAATLPVLGSVLVDRPQSFVFPLCAYLAWVATRAINTGEWPAWPMPAALTCLWANLHASWLLVPTVLAIVLALRAVDRKAPRHEGLSRSGAVALAAAVVGGLINPLGWRSLLLPLQFHESTRFIEEWQPTTIPSLASVGILVLAMSIVWAWTRSTERIPLAELGYVAAMVVFALMALRNIPCASLLMAPVVAQRLGVTFRPTAWAIQRSPMAAAVVVTAGLVLAAMTLVRYANAEPLKTAEPVELAERLAANTSDEVVFNEYNASGVLLFFAGRGTTLGIDGRADRYSPAYQQRYFDAQALRGGWRELLRDLDPDFAVLKPTRPIVHELVVHQEWKRMMRDGPYLLLRAPSATP